MLSESRNDAGFQRIPFHNILSNKTLELTINFAVKSKFKSDHSDGARTRSLKDKCPDSLKSIGHLSW